MPRPGGNPNLKGSAGSGRKSAYEEFNKSAAINKLWEKVNAKVQAGEKLSGYEEKLVLALLPKTIKQGLDLSATVTIKDLLSKYGTEEEDS